jgi:hypothetical protein
MACSVDVQLQGMAVVGGCVGTQMKFTGTGTVRALSDVVISQRSTNHGKGNS